MDNFLPGAFLSLGTTDNRKAAPLKCFLAQMSSPYAGYIKSILSVDYKTVGIDHNFSNYLFAPTVPA